MLCELLVELAADPPALRRLAHHLETDSEIVALELGHELLRASQLLQLPAEVAVEVELALLLAFTEARAVSLWRLSAAGEATCSACVGDAKADGLRARQLAARLLAGERIDPPPRSSLSAVTIDALHGRTVLVACGGRGPATRRQLLVEAAIPVLAATLAGGEFATHSSEDKHNDPGPNDQMAAAERRLARVRFDLHDGPQQDLMLLAEDLRLFRSQLDSVLSESDKRECLLGRIDDLEARLTALDGDLRRIAVSAESPFLHGESLQDAVVELVGAFAERAGIEPEVRLEGDFTGLSESQHITLLGLMRESLSNIREHSHAKHVWIAISGGPAGVEATVTDDGRGFEPEATLVKAAREGHLGLVGMHERVRLLGGHTEIDSRPGGPTAISVKLPKAPEGAARRGSHTRRRASG